MALTKSIPFAPNETAHRHGNRSLNGLLADFLTQDTFAMVARASSEKCLPPFVYRARKWPIRSGKPSFLALTPSSTIDFKKRQLAIDSNLNG